MICFSFLTAATLLISCSQDERKKKPEKLIPVNTLISVLAETSLADGIINATNLREEFVAADSLRAYADIVEKYGFTMEEMDKSLQYYFFNRQKQLIEAYDKALAIVSEMQTRHLTNPADLPERAEDMWTKKRHLHLPAHHNDDSAEFAIKVDPPGYYSILFTVRLAPYDQSKYPSFLAWTCNPDSLYTGKRTFLETIRYFADGASHTYSVTGYIGGEAPVILGGTFYSTESETEEGMRSALITVDFFNFTKEAL